MRCPACGTQMRHEMVVGVELDQCAACKGFWFDDGEVGRLVPLLAEAGNVPELDARIIHTKPVPGRINPQRRCPHCSTVMANFNYCYDSNVLLDRCPGCRGVWMDGGELAAVAQYVKGNPRLDRLAGAIADRVRTSEGRKTTGIDLRTQVGHAMMLPGYGGVAMLLAAVVDFLHRWHED